MDHSWDWTQAQKPMNDLYNTRFLHSYMKQIPIDITCNFHADFLQLIQNHNPLYWLEQLHPESDFNWLITEVVANCLLQLPHSWF